MRDRTGDAAVRPGALILGVFMRPNHFAEGQTCFTGANPGGTALLLPERQRGVGGAFELLGLCMQRADALAERVEAAAIAPHRIAEA